MSVISHIMYTTHSLAIPHCRLHRFVVLFCLAFSLAGVSAATVTDVLNHADLTATGTAYTDFSGVKKTSAAVYAGNTAVQNHSIGMRSSGNNSGIVTTASGGKVRRITVKWTSETAGRTLQVYGKNTAYSGTSDLYGGSATQGTLIGEIVYGTNSSITISGDYEYIGLRSKTGMLSVKDLTIDWETGSGTELQEPNVAFAHASVTREYTSLQYQQQANTTTGYDGTLTYSCTNTGYFNINSQTGMVSWSEGAAGQQTIVTATAPQTANYKSGLASYTLTLTSPGSDADVYTLVTDAAQIQTNGTQYILVADYGNPSAYYALGAQNGSYRTAVAVTPNGNEIDVAGLGAVAVTLTSVGNGQYALSTGGNYYLTCASSGAALTTANAATDEKTHWTIEAADGKYRVMNASATTRGIAYNYNNGNPRFGAYIPSESFKAAYLYVKGTPQVETVNTIAALRELEDGTTVRLTLSEQNRGEVTYNYNGSTTEAYVRDQTSAVLFDNFLTNDPGWHTQKDMALIGSVMGQYRVVNGMPTFVSAGTAAKADDILCLDNFCDVTPTAATLATALGTTLRADYIRIADMGVRITGSGSNATYALTDGNNTLTIDNGFGISSISLAALAADRTYTATGILTTDASGNSLLRLTEIEELTPDVSLDETSDNTTSLATYNGRTVNVVVNRQFTAGMWNTLALPFSVSAMDDLFPNTQVAAFTGYNAATHTLLFTSVNSISAGQPYLILPTTETEAQLVVNGVQLHKDAATVTQGDYAMHAVFSPVSFSIGDRSVLFLGQNNTLYYPNTGNAMKAFRAYFKAAADAPLASISVDGIATGIDTIATDPLTTTAPVYNLSGQRMQGSIDTLPRGVYIVNGMKVIVK